MDIIRRSPAGLVVRIIIVEILIELTYVILSTLFTEIRGTFGDSYQTSRLLLSLLFMLIAVTAVVILVSQWINETYYLKNNELVVRKGTIAKTEIAYPYANMQSVTVHQGLIGRLFNYGQINIFIPTLGKDIVFNEISSPQDFAEKIKIHIPYPENGQYLLRR